MGLSFASISIILLALPGVASAEFPTEQKMTYIHVFPDGELDVRVVFAWEILRQALERTRTSYGDYSIVEARVRGSQRRQLRSRSSVEGEANTAFLPAITTVETDAMAPVRIPVFGGLWGYRVFLIRAGDQAHFDRIQSLPDLMSISIGQPEFWSDVNILKNAGLNVVTGTSYEGMFRMLESKRFDAFSRSISEILPEYELRKEMTGGVSLEQHLLLHYPMPEYFWFSSDEKGRHLAERVREGLLSMVTDGSLLRMLEKRYQPEICHLDLRHRRVIELVNPLLGPEDHLDDPSFWYPAEPLECTG